ncbi:MAG: YIP1 family protein [Deltaproteobacteria bacterium]
MSRTPLRRTALLVAGYAAVYAGFCLWIHAGGHTPSAPSPLVSPSKQYLVQAVLLVPASLLIWGLVGATVHAVARALGGHGDRAATLAEVGRAWAAPTLVVFVLPDVVTYAVGGFEAIAKTTRLTAPLTLVLVCVLMHFAVRRTHGLSGLRAALAVVAGIVVLGALHGPWLR